MSAGLVTVVIPAFQEAGAIEECLDLVRAQTWGDLQVLVADGGSTPTARKDNSAVFRERYAAARLTDEQAAAIRWLAAQPGGPAKILMISEDWSSDCRRDVPMMARLAETGGLELRIFNRDGRRFAEGPRSAPAESPNADLVNAYLSERDGRTFQSIPVIVIFSADFVELHRHIERPALYRRHRDRIVIDVA